MKQWVLDHLEGVLERSLAEVGDQCALFVRYGDGFESLRPTLSAMCTDEAKGPSDGPPKETALDDDDWQFRRLLRLPLDWRRSYFSFEEGFVPSCIANVAEYGEDGAFVEGAVLGQAVGDSELELDDVLRDQGQSTIRVRSSGSIVDTMLQLLLLGDSLPDSPTTFQTHLDRLRSDRDAFLEADFDGFSDFLEAKWGDPLVHLHLGEGGSQLAIFDTLRTLR